jgi:hypothetical protein
MVRELMMPSLDLVFPLLFILCTYSYFIIYLRVLLFAYLLLHFLAKFWNNVFIFMTCCVIVFGLNMLFRLYLLINDPSYAKSKLPRTHAFD